MLSTDKSARWLVLLLTSIVLAALFWPVIIHPNDYFFGSAGDAIKSYYAIDYYVHYDHGLHFSGMNYPNGEHINYPDMQPLVSGVLGWLNHHGLPLAPYTIGILNSITLLSLLITPLVLLAIGRHLGLPRGYAVAVALIVAFLAPQHERLDSHASLAYACLFPMLWYALLRLVEQPKRPLWYVVYVALCVISGLLHTYFVLVGTLFLLAYALVWAVQEYGRRPLARQLALWLITALAPLVLFRLWLFFTDPITDRPPNPYGFFVYTASLTSVFLPVVSPLREAWQTVLHTDEVVWEGYSYVGIVGVLAALLTLVRLGQRLGRRQWTRVLRPVLPAPLRTAVWAAVLLLLLAMALPFRLPGGAKLLDLISPLKQFRSLGRFAWVFYYVFTLYAAYYFYRLYRYLGRHRAAPFGRTMLLLLLLAWAGEALLTISTKATQIRSHEVVSDFISEGGNYRERLSNAGHYADDYQAMLALPFSSVGTDKFDLTNSEKAQFEGYKAALSTGIPLLNSYMTRTSVTDALRHFQLLGGDLIPKPLVQEFPSRKPILLVVTHESLQPYEERLVKRSRKLYEDEYTTLYELPLDSLTATRQQQQLALFDARRAQLVPGPDGTLRTTSKGVLLNTFADKPNSRFFLRPGAFSWPDGFAQLYRGSLPAPADTGMYEVSVWVNARTAYGLGNMQVKQYDQAGQQVDHQVFDTRHGTEVYGDWVRAAVPIRVRDVRNTLEVLYENMDLVADEFMIRPLDTDVYYFIGQGDKRQLIFNNYPLGHYSPSPNASLSQR